MINVIRDISRHVPSLCHPIVKKGFFRPLILGCEPRFVKNCSKRAFLKGRIEPKEAALPNSTFGGLYICSICCVCVCVPS